jgi:hypothetical protein
MPEPKPSHFEVADELAARITAEARAYATAELLDRNPDLVPAADMLLVLSEGEAASYALAQVRFAHRVLRELGWRLDWLADQARKAGASDVAVDIATGDRSPDVEVVEREGPTDV